MEDMRNMDAPTPPSSHSRLGRPHPHPHPHSSTSVLKRKRCADDEADADCWEDDHHSQQEERPRAADVDSSVDADKDAGNLVIGVADGQLGDPVVEGIGLGMGMAVDTLQAGLGMGMGIKVDSDDVGDGDVEPERERQYASSPMTSPVATTTAALPSHHALAPHRSQTLFPFAPVLPEITPSPSSLNFARRLSDRRADVSVSLSASSSPGMGTGFPSSPLPTPSSAAAERTPSADFRRMRAQEAFEITFAACQAAAAAAAVGGSAPPAPVSRGRRRQQPQSPTPTYALKRLREKRQGRLAALEQRDWEDWERRCREGKKRVKVQHEMREEEEEEEEEERGHETTDENEEADQVERQLVSPTVAHVTQVAVAEEMEVEVDAEEGEQAATARRKEKGKQRESVIDVAAADGNSNSTEFVNPTSSTSSSAALTVVSPANAGPAPSAAAPPPPRTPQRRRASSLPPLSQSPRLSGSSSRAPPADRRRVGGVGGGRHGRQSSKAGLADVSPPVPPPVPAPSARPPPPPAAKRPQRKPLALHQLLTLHMLQNPRGRSSDLLRRHAHGTQAPSAEAGVQAQYYVPPLVPPITVATLRELDWNEITQNAQLRHDIVFDPGLMFRPNFDGERGEKKREHGDRYWLAVANELASGCRCTAFSPSGDQLPCICRSSGPSATSRRDREQPQEQTLSTSLTLASRLPSRVPALIAELRNILLSLLPTLPVPASGSGSWPQQNDPYRPINETLDPDFIAQQLAYGVLDVAGLAKFMGETLKQHCAPMRDEFVDHMVDLIQTAARNRSAGVPAPAADPDWGVSRGLKICLEILELMKLDIANHNLRQSRPALVQTALDFEMRYYREASIRRKATGSSGPERTRVWFLGADSRMSVQRPATDMQDRIRNAIRDGLLDLVFQSEPIRSSRSMRRSRQLLPSLSAIPDTLALDITRLQLFHAEATELTVVYMLIMFFRQLAAPVRVGAEDVLRVRREITTMLGEGHRLGTFAHEFWQNWQMGNSIAPIGPRQSATPESWRDIINDIVLQVASRAARIKEQGSTVISEVSPRQQFPQLNLPMIHRWVDANLRPDSKLFLVLHRKVRETLDAVLEEELAREDREEPGVGWWLPTPDAATVALQTLTPTQGLNGSPSLARHMASVAGKASARFAPGMAFSPIGLGLKTAVTSRTASPFATPTANRKRSRQDDEEDSDDHQRTDKRARLDGDDLPSGLASFPPSSPHQSVKMGWSTPDTFRSPAATTPGRQTVPQLVAKNGLTDLAAEIGALGIKLGKVYNFHVRCFAGWYEEALREWQASHVAAPL